MSTRPGSGQSRTAWDDGYGDGIRNDPDLGMDDDVMTQNIPINFIAHLAMPYKTRSLCFS